MDIQHPRVLLKAGPVVFHAKHTVDDLGVDDLNVGGVVQQDAPREGVVGHVVLQHRTIHVEQRKVVVSAGVEVAVLNGDSGDVRIPGLSDLWSATG